MRDTKDPGRLPNPDERRKGDREPQFRFRFQGRFTRKLHLSVTHLISPFRIFLTLSTGDWTYWTPAYMFPLCFPPRFCSARPLLEPLLPKTSPAGIVVLS